jgi:predicted dehydrogenase
VRGLIAAGIWSILMAIGCYPIQAALLAFDHEEPVSVIASGQTQIFQGELTDRMATVTLVFKNGRMAVLNCHGEDIESVSSLTIYGTQGIHMC